MATKTKTKNFEAQLFKAADKLRKNIDAAEYKYVVLGLVFLKYISESFEELYKKLDQDEFSDAEDRDEYLAENVFFVPKEARWENIHASAKLPSIGQVVDDAMDAIERENKQLKNVLPKVYGKANLDKASLGSLIDLISDTELQAENTNSKDLFGRVYEYFLGEFANAEGKKGGQFYTPKSIVKLMVEMIEPYKGRVYDPAAGSGGMFIMSEKFVKEHQGRIEDITIYGQESNQTTWKLSKMNLAIRNIDSQNVLWNAEGSFLKDAHPDLKADYILANPPFNQKEWGGEFLHDDARWKRGMPSLSNANYAWIQHMLYHLAPNGVMAMVMSNSALSSKTNSDFEIRKRLVDDMIVECIVSLPKQLFYNFTGPACIWFLRRSRHSRNDEILFIDATKMGHLVDRTHRQFTDEDIVKISDIYHKWRSSTKDTNIESFCRTVKIQEVQEKGYNLSPNRHISSNIRNNSILSIQEELPRLNSFLREDTQYSKGLDSAISEALTSFFGELDWRNINFDSNEILERIGMAVYKEWFGRYNINKPERLPEGWRVGKIAEISSRESISYKCKKSDIDASGETPILDQGASGLYGYTTREPDFLADKENPVIIFTNHTCNFWFIDYPFCAIQNVIPYRAIDGYDEYFLYFMTKGSIRFTEYKGHWPDFAAKNFVIPPKEEAIKFSSIAKPILQKVSYNRSKAKKFLSNIN